MNRTAQDPNEEPKGPLVTLDGAKTLMKQGYPFWRIRIECKNEKSNKFWEINGGGTGEYVVSRWGRIGHRGASATITSTIAFQRLKNRLRRGYAYAGETL